MRTSLFLSLSLMAACAKTASEEPILSFRFECEPGAPGSITLEVEPYGEVSFGPEQAFDLAYVNPISGRLGTLSIAFEIKESQQQRFTDLTASHVRKKLAIFVDGEFMSASEIGEPLPGMGILTAEGSGFSEQERNDLIDRLNRQIQPR
ncbi:MAG: hypothetical protein O3A20_00845 [Planctomycetota bacterium]|nr:hypothetical protein [Planctomycetota bacterium]